MNREQTPDVWYNKFWFTRNFAWLIVALVSCFYDIKYFLVFRNDMKNLSKDPRSLFSKMGLRVNWLGNIVYTHKILDEDRVLYLDERQKNNFLIDNTRMEHDYLFHDLNWGEFLITNFVEFADERDNPSGYYGIEFKFEPISLTNKKIYFLLIFYLCVIGLILWLTRHWIWMALMYILELMKM